MKTIGAFTLEKLTEEELFRLATECMMEQERRKRKREEKRKNWIDKHYNQFQGCYGDYKVVGNTVIIALAWMGNVKMATATAVKGDKFDLHTGIAVAYAKANGERIPDFI